MIWKPTNYKKTNLRSVSEKGFLQDVRHNFVGYCARMRARSGLRQLNSGEISRKVGRADCGNDFSDTLRDTE